jgi:hypothetical protein
VDGGDPAGGSAALARLIDQYGEFLVPDLLSTYGVDLRDLFVPEAHLTPLYVFTLIKGLNYDSAFVAERRGGQQFRGWNESRYAAVATVNAVRALQYTYVAANSKSKPKPPDSFPIPERQTKQVDKPGSFAFIAAAKLAAAKKRKAGG